MTVQRQKPADRIEKLGGEIGEAQARLGAHSAQDWTGGLGALLEDLSHDLNGVDAGAHAADDMAHAKLDEIERRLAEARSRIASAEKLKA